MSGEQNGANGGLHRRTMMDTVARVMKVWFAVAAVLAIGACTSTSGQGVVLTRPEPGVQPQAPIEAAQAAAVDGVQNDGWPRQYQSGQLTFTVYQPQVDSWDRATLRARAAVAALRQGA